MVVKDRPKPLLIFFLEALLSRLLSSHTKIPAIEGIKGTKEAGYVGEQRIDFYLTYLPEKEYYILHDLYLSNGKFHFQIDTLIITFKYILVIEIKNMKGELEFDEESGQLVQKVENVQNAYDDPILQAQFQLRELRKLFLKHNFPNLPFEYLVFSANSNCVLNTEKSPDARNRVCRGRMLVKRIEEFTDKYCEEKLTLEMIKKICKFLLKNHSDPSYDIEKMFKIPRNHILPGVHCPFCGYLGMNYSRGNWYCPKCASKSRDAQINALRDYYLLFGPFITNEQFRKFLHLPSMKIASNILTRMKLPHSGSKKQRVYQLPKKLFTR